jgi:hypothetical protein
MKQDGLEERPRFAVTRRNSVLGTKPAILTKAVQEQFLMNKIQRGENRKENTKKATINTVHTNLLQSSIVGPGKNNSVI